VSTRSSVATKSSPSPCPLQLKASFVKALSSPPSLQSRRDRVAAKFVEAEFEKCDRLMEIYARYEGRVAAEEAK